MKDRFMTPSERGAHRNAVLRGPKPLLVGESNPYGTDPRYALYPYRARAVLREAGVL